MSSAVFFEIKIMTKTGKPSNAMAQKLFDYCQEEYDWFNDSMVLEDNVIHTDYDNDYGSDVDFDAESEPFDWLKSACRDVNPELMEATCDINLTDYRLENGNFYAEGNFKDGKFRVVDFFYYSDVYGTKFTIDSCYGSLIGDGKKPVVLRLRNKDTGKEESFPVEVWPTEDDGESLYNKVENGEYRLCVDGIDLVDECGDLVHDLSCFDFAKTFEGSNYEGYEFVSVDCCGRVNSEENIKKANVEKESPKAESLETIVAKDHDDLKEIIEREIAKYGKKCDLNHIDVSNVTDMSCMFKLSKFKGDISRWDVSNVTNMCDMFAFSKFDGDISSWDVSNVTNMQGMFMGSKFNGDISRWNVSNVMKINDVFEKCDFAGNIMSWKLNERCDYLNEEFFISVEVSVKELKEAIDSVIGLISEEYDRYGLHGVYLKISDGELCFVGCDGHQGGKAFVKATSCKEDFCSVLLPGVLNYVRNHLPGELVKIKISKERIAFENDLFSYRAYLNDLTYPNVDGIIPADFAFTLDVNRSELQASCQKLASKIKESFGLAILSYKEGMLSVAIDDDSVAIKAAKDGGEQFDIGFDVNLLTNVISKVKTDSLRMKFTSPTTVCVVEPVCSSDALFFMMPMRIN